MRDIVLARLDKTRPVLVLTRAEVRDVMSRVTVAPISSTVKGLSSEVAVGVRNGLDLSSVVSCDNIMTIATAQLGRQIGYLYDDQEGQLATAIVNAFALEASAPADLINRRRHLPRVDPDAFRKDVDSVLDAEV